MHYQEDSYFIKYIVFIGRKKYLIKNSKKYLNFNISKLAEELEVSPQTLNKWIHGQKISKIGLEKLSKRISELLEIEITPDILINKDLSTELNKIRDQQAIYSTKLNQIHEYLKKHTKLQKPILEILKAYDKKG